MTAEKFTKMVAFLRSPVGARVRTNNHVERMNRRLRQEEKVRYRWRQARSVVRFVVLAVARQWQSRRATEGPELFQPGAAGRRVTAVGPASGGNPECQPTLGESKAA